MIGRTLGHYRIVDRLGSGGMGVVWLAEDLKLGRKVALKVLREDLADSPEKAARFEREARAIAALSHPSIVTLHAVEEIDGVRFLAMEYLEGRTLDQLVREGPLPVAELLRIAIPIAEALEAAHARGILHRDLKPSNVMVCTDGRVKVLDFGLAKLLEDPARPFDGKDETTLTREGQVVGTLHYSSPEQLRQETVDARTDIYSFGAVLYEMATGRVPFQGDSAAQVITAVLCDVPRRIDELDGRIPTGLAILVEDSLAKEAASRPSGAGNIRRHLEGLASSSGGDSETVKRLEKRRRNPEFAAPRLLVSVAAFVSVAFMAWILVEAADKRSPNPFAPSRTESERVLENLPSVVVLPFRAVSDEPEYLLDGMTDGVISALGEFPSLRVISRQSAFHFKGTTKLPEEIASDLKVEYVAEATVARSADGFHLTLRWHRVLPPKQVLQQEFVRRTDEVLRLYDDLADEIKLLSSNGQDERVPDRPRSRLVDPRAFEAYLKGQFFVNKMIPESLDQAIRHFQEALKHDPDLAVAYVGLADSFGLKAYLYDDPREFAEKQEEALQAALERDPSNGLAHAMYAEQRRYHHWDWPGAEAAFSRAIELAPGDPRVRRCYWAFLVSIGRYREASVQLEVAGRLDPFSPAIPWDRGFQAAIQGDYSKALLEVRRSLEIDPGYVWSHALIWFLGHEGVVSPQERDLAMAAFLRQLGYAELAGSFEIPVPPGNEDDRLLETARRFEEISRQQRVPVGLLGMLFAAAGDLESAERVIVGAYQARSPELVWLGQDPSYRELRRRPAIRKLLLEMKLDPAADPALP